MVDKVIDVNKVPPQKIIDGHFKQLLVSDDEKEIQISRITVEPNAQGLGHTHSTDEWVYILKGSMIDHTGEFNSGKLLFNKAGSKHAVKAGPNGYEIIIFYLGKSDANPHLSPGYSEDSSGKGSK